MQVVQGNFYQSNPRPGADGGLEHERQLLVEEQKLCRSRARKFSLETNRRRKALEDRRKQWDVQEQQLIENVLKQRRQRVQDATERFQRAYLPPSQRRRQPLRRNIPNIEEALNQIQGSSSSYAQQPSFLSSISHVSRSCTPSPGPPAVSKSSHRQALSAVAAYTKLLQEQSTTSLESSRQTEKPPEKQRDHSPQDSQLSDCCNTESLSSKDSLENDDPDHSTRNLQYPYSSLLIDSEKLHPDLREQKDLCPTSDLTSLSALMLLSDRLPQSRKLRGPDQQKQGDSEGPNKKLQISKASWGFAAYEQTPKTETRPALHNCNLLSLCEIISGGPEHFEVNASQNSPSDNIIATNRDASSRTALHSSRPKQEALLDLRRNEIHDELKHPAATEMILLAKNGNNKVFGPPPKPNISLNDTTTDNGSQKGNLQQTGAKIQNLSSQKEPRSSINNLNKVSNPEPTAEKPIHETNSLSNIQSDSPKCLTCAEQEVPNVPVSVRSSHSVCGVRFIKGILKKQSKYMSGDTTCVYGSGHLIFAKQVALAIRDSVELTRTKTKDVGGNNGVKKKLRWSDEVTVPKEDKEQNIMRQMKGKSNLPQSNNNSEDHQLSLTTVSGASKPGPGMTPPASSGYHFTKQAWADVGVQVSLPQERADEVKVPRSSTRTGGPKVPRRERSARAGAGPVSSRTRKGTVIRPQSATEVSRIAKTQGKILEPRPPPRMESDKTAHIAKTPYGAAHTGVNCKQALAEQAPHKDDSDSPYTHNAIRTDSTVMYTPLPPSCTFSISKGNVKGRPSSGHHGCRRRRGMVDDEKGLCLDCTPTDEEILQLWHGVRGALATKDATNLLRRQALDCGRAARKSCMEQSRQPAGSGNRMLPQTSEPVRLSSAYNTAFPDSGLVSAAQAHLAEGHAGGRLEETDIVAAVETAQTQRSGTVQQRSQQKALTTISLEEQKILLSLDRLNHQLYAGTCGGLCGHVWSGTYGCTVYKRRDGDKPSQATCILSYQPLSAPEEILIYSMCGPEWSVLPLVHYTCLVILYNQPRNCPLQ